MADLDVSAMKVADLKRELRLRGLSATGNKTELQERLQASMLDGELALEDSAISEGLLDDEDVLTDEEKSPLDLSHEDAVLTTPPIESEKNDLISSVPAKKVVLKRNISHTFPALTESSSNTTNSDKDIGVTPPKTVKSEGSEGSNSANEQPNSAESKKIIKLSELSSKDRLELRAKKFGLQATTDDAKQARAIRFGESSTTNSGPAANGTNSTSIDILKKRAERFGCSVSSRMTELEMKEKLMKRQERFGSEHKVTNQKDTKPEASTDYAERAKQRLARFKTAVK